MSVTDGVCLAGCVLAFTAWNVLSTRAVSWQAPVFFSAFGLSCVLAGRVGMRLASGRRALATDFATTFLLGFFLISIALLVLALVSPLGLVADSALLMAIIAALHVQVSRGVAPTGRRACLNYWCIMAVAIALSAATLWCQSSVYPLAEAENGVIHKPWADSYYHASQIRMFRNSHGLGTLQEFRLSGSPPLFYHYAGYLTPALLASWTPTTTFLAFCGFMVPVGIFLTGLAAFALARSFWGDRAGFGATLAVLLLPDATSYGWGNRWLSFHWLQIISPTGAIGVAVLALSWIFMIGGCRRGSLRLIASSYLIAFLSIQFKAQLFVANAFLLWVYPSIFLRGPSRGRKFAWFMVASLVFFAVAGISQRFERVPLLRPSRGAARAYMSFTLEHASWIRAWFPGAFQPQSLWLGDLGIGAALLFFGTFGLLGLACLAIVVSGRVRMRPAIRMFPLLVMANYLAMALLLSPDDRAVANPEELQHRPLVWADFVVAAWVGGLGGRLLFGRRLLPTESRRVGLALATFVLLIYPLRFGRDVQRGPDFGWTHIRHVIPRGLVDSCSFLREHSGVRDVVQDSANDPALYVVCLSERQAFASYPPSTSPPASFRHHIDELELLRRMDDERDIRELAARNRLSWYLLRPEDRVSWPASILDHPAFESRGYRVYHLLAGG